VSDRTGAPAATDVIPLARPMLGEEEERAVIEVLRWGQLSLGPRVAEFERLFAERVGARCASAVSSGTAGLHLAPRAVGVKDRDEVITSPFSFVASVNAVLYERARPVFADIDPVTLNLDPAAAEAAITERFERIAEKHGLALVEDACQALGAVHEDGVPVGGRGHPAVFGFYANKQLTTGEGGWSRWDRASSRSGSIPSAIRDAPPTWGGSITIGWGSTTGCRTSHARSGSRRWGDWQGCSTTGREWRLVPGGALGGIDGLELPCEDSGNVRRGWFVFVVQLPQGADRDAIVLRQRGLGVQSKPYLPAIHV
jgi:perosamine synthetase